jgi:predicted nucleic acid-binding protein
VTTLVWDASGLHHAARADRLDVLGDVAKAYRNVTTAAVVQELDRYGLASAVEQAGWLEVVHVDGLAELRSLVAWVARLSAGVHHQGEATVCAWADVHGATAVVDDRDARTAAARGGIAVHGSLWVVAQGVRSGRLGGLAADGFVSALVREGARYPLDGRTFSAWARDRGLL